MNQRVTNKTYSWVCKSCAGEPLFTRYTDLVRHAKDAHSISTAKLALSVGILTSKKSGSTCTITTHEHDIEGVRFSEIAQEDYESGDLVR